MKNRKPIGKTRKNYGTKKTFEKIPVQKILKSHKSGKPTRKISKIVMIQNEADYCQKRGLGHLSGKKNDTENNKKRKILMPLSGVEKALRRKPPKVPKRVQNKLEKSEKRRALLKSYQKSAKKGPEFHQLPR